MAPALPTAIDRNSESFRSNADAMRAAVADLRQHLGKIALGGGDAARERHRARGKMLPRERIDALIDPGAPFLEFSPLAG